MGDRPRCAYRAVAVPGAAHQRVCVHVVQPQTGTAESYGVQHALRVHVPAVATGGVLVGGGGGGTDHWISHRGDIRLQYGTLLPGKACNHELCYCSFAWQFGMRAGASGYTLAAFKRLVCYGLLGGSLMLSQCRLFHPPAAKRKMLSWHVKGCFINSCLLLLSCAGSGDLGRPGLCDRPAVVGAPLPVPPSEPHRRCQCMRALHHRLHSVDLPSL